MDGEQERAEVQQQGRIVFGVANRALIRKTEITVISYPELRDCILKMVEVLEGVYTQGFELGREVGEQHAATKRVIVDNRLPRKDPYSTT